MQLNEAKKERKQVYRIMLFIGIIFAAFNLRPAITSVGPVIGMIRQDLELANWSVGFITTLPLIAFAIISPLVPKVARVITNERLLLWGLFILIIGISARAFSNVILLFIGTGLVGIGIAISNVLLPSIIKEKYPLKVGVMTSVYSTAMGLFAAIASGLSVPIATGLNLGWELALAVWVLPAILSSLIWLYLFKRDPVEKETDIAVISSSQRMWRSPLAWQVALYMGLQSFLFYVTISWLPEILHVNNGLSIETAGWMLSLLQFLGLPASFIVPMWAGRMKSQKIIVFVLFLSSTLGFSGLLFASSTPALLISIVLLGVTLGGTFPLALTLIGLRVKTAPQAAELSGMAQSIGYLLAAVGPVLIGYLRDVTQSWTVPLLMLIGISLLVFVAGLGAGRDRYVFE